jgi:hypothetical protein
VKYEPADLNKIARNCDYLTNDEQTQFFSLLHKYHHLFDGSLVTWNAKQSYNLELKPNAKPYHSRPYPVPKIHEATLMIEFEYLTKQGRWCFKESQPKQIGSTHLSNSYQKRMLQFASFPISVN